MIYAGDSWEKEGESEAVSVVDDLRSSYLGGADQSLRIMIGRVWLSRFRGVKFSLHIIFDNSLHCSNVWLL